MSPSFHSSHPDPTRRRTRGVYGGCRPPASHCIASSLQVFVDDDEEDSGFREAQRLAAASGSKGEVHRKAEESQIKVCEASDVGSAAFSLQTIPSSRLYRSRSPFLKTPAGYPQRRSG